MIRHSKARDILVECAMLFVVLDEKMMKVNRIGEPLMLHLTHIQAVLSQPDRKLDEAKPMQ